MSDDIVNKKKSTLELFFIFNVIVFKPFKNNSSDYHVETWTKLSSVLYNLTEKYRILVGVIIYLPFVLDSFSLLKDVLLKKKIWKIF